MLNYVVLVGRIQKMEVIKENLLNVSLLIHYGDYKKDITVPIIITDQVGESVLKYCNDNDVVGIKGEIINDNGNISIKANKVSFLSNHNIHE